MHRVVIVGHEGQDGRILWDQLAALGHSLVGVGSRGIRTLRAASHPAVDVADAGSVHALIETFEPDRAYYLAAHHHSSQDDIDDEMGLWQNSWNVHVHGFRNLLDAIRSCRTSTRVFYASSSRVFGLAESSPQTERTPLRPVCVYGMTKATGMTLADFYRRNHGLFVSCGILFNHESPLRGREFVSQRIAHGLVELREGRLKTLNIGDMNTRVDWGYAPDFTQAMQMILEAEAADDFVIATGRTHAIRDMVRIAAEYLDFDWEGRIVEDARILRRPPQDLCGDFSHLRAVTRWHPRTAFREMVHILVKAADGRDGPNVATA